jgi:hypothetical protein
MRRSAEQPERAGERRRALAGGGEAERGGGERRRSGAAGRRMLEAVTTSDDNTQPPVRAEEGSAAISGSGKAHSRRTGGARCGQHGGTGSRRRKALSAAASGAAPASGALCVPSAPGGESARLMGASRGLIACPSSEARRAGRRRPAAASFHQSSIKAALGLDGGSGEAGTVQRACRRVGAAYRRAGECESASPPALLPLPACGGDMPSRPSRPASHSCYIHTHSWTCTAAVPSASLAFIPNAPSQTRGDDRCTSRKLARTSLRGTRVCRMPRGARHDEALSTRRAPWRRACRLRLRARHPHQAAAMLCALWRAVPVPEPTVTQRQKAAEGSAEGLAEAPSERDSAAALSNSALCADGAAGGRVLPAAQRCAASARPLRLARPSLAPAPSDLSPPQQTPCGAIRCRVARHSAFSIQRAGGSIQRAAPPAWQDAHLAAEALLAACAWSMNVSAHRPPTPPAAVASLCCTLPHSAVAVKRTPRTHRSQGGAPTMEPLSAPGAERPALRPGTPRSARSAPPWRTPRAMRFRTRAREQMRWQSDKAGRAVCLEYKQEDRTSTLRTRKRGGATRPCRRGEAARCGAHAQRGGRRAAWL